MPRFSFSLPALAAASLALAGCAGPSPYDARFGDAVRSARLAMVINPQAGASADPVAGIDGTAAREGFIRYQESFKTPPPVVNVISVGGGSLLPPK